MNLMDALSGIGAVLDTPGAMLRTGLAGENPLDAVFDTDKRVSGRELLEKYGLVGANEDQGWVPDAGDLGGFAAEMVLDPTNLIGGGLLARLMGKAGKAKAANKVIDAANTLSKEQRAMGFMPEEVAKLTKIVDETGAPKRMFHGTPHEFDKFDAEKLDPNALYGKGVYTTDSPDLASSYTRKGATKDFRVIPGKEREFNLQIAKERNLDLVDVPDELQTKLGFKKLSSSNVDGASEYLRKSGVSDDAITKLHANRESLIDRLSRGDLGSFQVQDSLDTARLNNRLPPQWSDMVHEIPSPENVRQHFIDARNPLNIDEVVSSVPAPLEKKLIQRNRDDIRAALADAKQSRNKIAWLKHAPDEDVGFRSFQETVRDPEEIRRLRDTMAQLATVNHENAINRLRNQLPFRNKATLSPRMTGEDVYDLLGNDGVREAGYDAINHVGGRNTGGAAHNVTIALDPSQVYLPYIARELQDLQHVASPNSLLALLGGKNLLQLGHE